MLRLRIVLVTLILLAAVVPALGADAVPKTFAVLPFAMHGPEKYQYLEQGIPSMLVSRLTWQDRYHPLDRSGITAASSQINSEAKAREVLDGLKADYLIWGSATILGQECSLDMNVMEAGGTVTPYPLQTSLDQLIPSLEAVARNINAKVFQRQEAPAVETQAKTPEGRPLNQDMIYNEAGNQGFYLNPDINFMGATENPGRWRSQTLDYSGLGMITGDADGDGKNEIFILDDHSVHAYRITAEHMEPLGTYEASLRMQCLNINLLDLNRDGQAEIIVSGIHENSASSFILNFRDGKFSVADERINLLLNVVRTPPEYLPVLIGQKMQKPSIFFGSVAEVIRVAGHYELGRALVLPAGTNVFNFTYLPAENEAKIVVADSGNHLRVFTSTNQIQYVTDELYAGSSLGLEVPDVLPGLAQRRPSENDPDMYFIPSRMVPVNLDRDSRFELLVNRNISVSAQFFSRYRFFPQGEIHNLFWDGIGLNISWKTRPIKGSIVDYGVGDLNSDGAVELYVCVNSHPGATGTSTRRTIVLTYALDLDPTKTGDILRPGGK